MSGRVDYTCIAELWDSLGKLADEADRLHMKILMGGSDGGAEYGGQGGLKRGWTAGRCCGRMRGGDTTR